MKSLRSRGGVEGWGEEKKKEDASIHSGFHHHVSDSKMVVA